MIVITTTSDDNGHLLTRPGLDWIAASVAFLMFLRVPGLSLFSASGLLLSIALAPVVLPRLLTSKRLFVLLAASAAALIAGIVLVFVGSSQQGTPGTPATVTTVIAWLACIPMLLALGLWCVARLGLRNALILMSLGGVASAALTEVPFGWKGSLGVYTTIIVLAWGATRRPWVLRLMIVASAVASAAFDARSMVLFACLTLVATLTNTNLSRRIRRAPLRWAIVLGGAALALAQLSLAAMKGGLLGTTVQARMLAQTANGRSLIEAGRTEWAGTLELMRQNPLGYGVGEHIGGGPARDAIAEIREAGGDVTASYFSLNVFGDRVDLHSMTADLWYHFGIAGLLLVCVMAVVLALGLPQAVQLRNGVGLASIFVILSAFWDLAFSPMANLDRLLLGLIAAAALGLGPLLTQARAPALHPSAPSSPPGRSSR